MSDHIKKVIKNAILTLVFAAIGAWFLYQVITTSDPLFFAPAGIGIVGTVVFAVLFIKEAFIGKNEYKIVNGALVVTRLGRTIAVVSDKRDILDLVYVYSFGSFHELHYICFTAQNQRFYADVLAKENSRLQKFFSGIEHKDSNSIVFYLIAPFAS